MAPGSTKDVVKAINTYISSAHLPLPDDLLEVIDSYLDKHMPLDDGDAQRLHEELLTIYQKEVQSQPGRYPSFLAILRQLRPAIGGYKRLLQWWDLLVVPVLDHLGNEKGLTNETRLILLEILAYDTDDEAAKADAERTSSVLTSRLLELWLKKSAKPDADAPTKFLHQQIHTVLMEYGRKRAKDLLAVMNKFFVQGKYRSQILSLLGEFIRYGPPHLYHLLQTPLWPSLMRCLQTDTSTTIISLAMTVLVMLLPNIPNSVRPYLPELFKIYSRLLFWERERGPSITDTTAQDEKEDSDSDDDQDWEKLQYSSDFDEETVPELLTFFTFLYGLYPINFMSYIRKPERYLRHANYDDSDDMDVQPSEVRQRSEPFRRVHLLHPNFFQMTLKSEINDPNRWNYSEAADVTAACMLMYCGPPINGDLQLALSQTSQATYGEERSASLAPDTAALSTLVVQNHNKQALLDQDASDLAERTTRNSWRNTTSTMVAPSEADTEDAARSDSPTLPPQSSSYEPRAEHQDSGSAYMDKSNYIEAYMQSLSRSQTLQPSNAETSTEIMRLHREIMLLKNDLNFERYLKQQHLSHIGQLRTRHVRAATVEAETQNLINVNRGLKSKLEEAKSTTAQFRRESEKSRAHSKKWEAELTSKLRALKEEQKKWLLESEDLHRQLAIARENIHQMRQMIVASESRELASKQKMQSYETNFDEIERLRAETEKLKTSVRTYEAREVAFEDAKTQTTLAEAKLERLKLRLTAQAAEIAGMHAENEQKMGSMNERLETVREEVAREHNASMQHMIDNALTALRARLIETQKAHSHLLRRFTNLEASYIAMKETRQDLDEPLLGGGAYFDSNPTSPSGAYSSIVAPRSGGGTSGAPPTPGSQDIRRIAHSHGRTSSLDSQTGTGTGSDAEVKDKIKVRPPEDTRMYGRGEFDLSSIRGRGGVQNISSAKKKEEKKDGGDKKDKKSQGLRGIRGFVS